MLAPSSSMMSSDHAGRGFFSLGVSCACPSPLCRIVLKGLANTRITGYSANGFWRLFRTWTMRVLTGLGIILEESMGMARSLWIDRWVFGASVPPGRREEELAWMLILLDGWPAILSASL